MVALERTYTIEAAHRLPLVPEGHKCGGLHGHTWRITLRVTGEPSARYGWLIDYGRLDELWEWGVRRYVDHNILNDVAGLDNPTSENFGAWIIDQIAPSIPSGATLSSVTVEENPESRCTVYDAPRHQQLLGSKVVISDGEG